MPWFFPPSAVFICWGGDGDEGVGKRGVWNLWLIFYSGPEGMGSVEEGKNIFGWAKEGLSS
jgi:hypothetical protein